MTSAWFETPAGAATRDRLIRLHARLRQRGLVLGLPELLDAFRALDGGFGVGSDDAFRRTVRLLWCHNPAENAELDAALEETPSEFATFSPTPSPQPAPRPTPDRPERRPPAFTQRPTIERPPEPSPQVELPTWSALPVRTPTTLDLETGGPGLLADRPISRRAMAYAWRYLRRPVADGRADVLDVEATISNVARKGVMLAPVFRRRLTDHAHIVLLLDQNGSMAPFHRFTRDLLETARDESTLPRVDPYYFHNLPALPSADSDPGLFLDPHLTTPATWNDVASGVSSETAALIVSDAGAARGGWNTDRVRATARFLRRLRRLTPLVAWLNPMPAARWSTTTAESVARLAAMFPMDPEGLTRAIEVLRGLAPSSPQETRP